MNKKTVAIFVILSLFVLLSFFVIGYVKSEETIYYWDHTVYWFKFIQLSQIAATNILQYFILIWQSIKTDIYNNFPIILLTPFYLIFGPSRETFIFSILSTYGLLSFFALAYILKLLNPALKLSAFALGIIFIAYLFSLDVLGVILRGYVDIGGILIIYLMLIIYLKSNWKEKYSRKTIIQTAILGLLCALLPIFRRYFAYSLIGFILALPVSELIILKSIKERKKEIINWMTHFFLLLFFLVTFFLIISRTLLTSMYSVDYTAAYAAWRGNLSIIEVFIKIIKDFGLINTALIFISIIYVSTLSKYRKILILSLLTLMISAVLFLRVQFFDYHHYYLLLGFIVLIESIFIQNISEKRLGPLYCLIISIIIVINTLQSLLPINSIHAYSIGSIPIFSQKYLPPLKRDDLNLVKEIVFRLDSNVNKNGKIYVSASSQYFSDDILRNQCYLMYSFEYSLCNSILGSTHVDSRDGFPTQMLTANYVIITSPIQYHLNPDQQKTVTFVSNFIEANSEKYVLLFQQKITNGITVSVYKNSVPIQKRTIRNFEDIKDEVN